MAEVFISYKTQRRNAAQHLSRILELNGYGVRFNDGLRFRQQIERELRAAKASVGVCCRCRTIASGDLRKRILPSGSPR